MAIPIFNYVGITSGVGGNNQVPTRNYGALVITGNNLCPTGTILTFQSATGVLEYFGSASEEYARAEFYFGWVSKNITAPALLSFWFWNNDTATTDLIFGAPPIDTLAEFNAITSGELELTMGGVTHTLTGINLSAAGSLAAVATDITTAIQAYSAGGAQWTAAVVTYNSTTGAFNLVSGTAAADTIGVQAAAANDLAGPLGWLSPNTILSNGTAAQTLANNVAALVNISNNFGSICTTFSLALTLTNTEVIANWNNSLTPNVQFIYSVNVTPSNASAWSAALLEIGGTTLTLQSPGAQATIEFPEMAPMMIFAATNYTQPNSVQNYKYQEFTLTPSVTTQAGYNTYTALLINFYGQTQTAGQLISFYQNGYMMGLSTNPQYQNLYANEIWFKDNLAAALLNLLVALSQIPANNTGRGLILAQLQSVINVALLNGTISIGKPLNSTQQLYITQVTGSSKAWQQVQTQGYWVNVDIQSSVVDSVTTYTAVYTLVYSKDDVVQSITGSNILI
jgi:hypothetical protein